MRSLTIIQSFYEVWRQFKQQMMYFCQNISKFRLQFNFKIKQQGKIVPDTSGCTGCFAEKTETDEI